LSQKNTNNKELMMRTPRAILFALITLGFSGSAYAGLASCSGTYNLGTSTSGLLPGGSSSAGCEQTDKEFNAFNYTPGTNPVVGSSVNVNFLGSVDTGPIGVQFGPTGWAADCSAPCTTTTTASTSYNVAVDPAPPAPYAPPAGDKYAIDAMALGENVSLTTGFPQGSNDSIVLYEYFCAGGAALCSGGSAATGGINLSAATAGFLVYNLTGNGSGYTGITSVCFNNGNTTGTDCAALSSSADYITNTSLVNFLASSYSQGFQNVSTYTSLNVTSGGDPTLLNYFVEDYFQELETPEPATFGLMGAALAGLGLLNLRKRT
jgi:hypothetical protein